MAAKYILFLIFVLVYILFGNELGFSDTSPVWTHFTYSFQHAGLVHLIANSLAFILTFGVMEKFVSWKILFPVIYACAVIASFFSENTIPTIGASGMVYALFGMETVIVFLSRSTKKQKSIFFVSISLMLLLSFLNVNSNFMVHLLSFCLGCLFLTIKRKMDFHKPIPPK